ncbi:unnamed protein product, partial [Mesorhabditis belari]|uniref:Uncharacterized protein n=1 Tax=Mesorhabditis belari TaxID=2138241 RepID=A0AAF3EMV0_9BILA
MIPTVFLYYFLRNQVRMRRLKREVGLETDQPKEIESSSESSDSESEDMGKAVLLMKITQVEITQVEITQVGSRYELANLMLLSILVFIANFTLIFLLKRNPNRSIHSTMNRKYELVDRSRQAADV